MSPEIPVLFAYGTLMEPRLLAGVLGRALDGLVVRPAAAPGFRTVFYPGRIYPALVEAEGGVAEGLAIGGLSAADWEILDLFEGDEYVRGELAIRLLGDAGKPSYGREIIARKPEVTASETGISASYYRPLAAIPAEARSWRFSDWRREHGEATIVAEGETAAAIRRRLIDRSGTQG